MVARFSQRSGLTLGGGGGLMTNGCLSSIADGALPSAMSLLNGFILSFTLQGLQQPRPSVCLGRGGRHRGTLIASDCRAANSITLTAPTHFWCIFLTCCSLYYFTFYSLGWQRDGFTHSWEREFIMEGQVEVITGPASDLTVDYGVNTCIKKIKFVKAERENKAIA